MFKKAHRKTLLVSIFLCSCGGTPIGATRNEPVAQNSPPEVGTGFEDIDREPTPDEARVFSELMAEAERIRGLSFVRPVPARVRSRSVITRFIEQKIAEDREELNRQLPIYLALGLIPADLDVERLLRDLLGEQVVGYYDDDTGQMAVRSDVISALSGPDTSSHEGRTTLVHEYIHALQDQHLNLHSTNELTRSFDGDNAWISLVEGDASFAMLGTVYGASGPSLGTLAHGLIAQGATIFVAQRSAATAANPVLREAPAILRETLLSRYTDGLLFVSRLYLSTRSWAAVDNAFTDLPQSTEQVLHPEKYLSREAPITVVLPEVPSLASYRTVVEETLGELETGVFLAQGTSSDRNSEAAAGWGGDRIRVYQTGASFSAVWSSIWDSELDADEFLFEADRIAPTLTTASVVSRGRRALLVTGFSEAERTEIVRVWSAQP